MLEIKRIKYARQAALFLLMVACLVAGGVRAAHAEDTALVIGINNYPRLGKGADLKGCVHDAERIVRCVVTGKQRPDRRREVRPLAAPRPGLRGSGLFDGIAQWSVGSALLAT